MWDNDADSLSSFLRTPPGVTILSEHPAHLLRDIARARSSEGIPVSLAFDIVAYQRSQCRDPSYTDLSEERRDDFRCVIDASLDGVDLSIAVALAGRQALAKLTANAVMRADILRPHQAIDMNEVEVGCALFVECMYGTDGVKDRMFLPACDLDKSVTEDQLPGIAKQLDTVWQKLLMHPTPVVASDNPDDAVRVRFYATGNGYHAYVEQLLHESVSELWFSDVRQLPFVDEAWARASLRAPRRNGVLRWSAGAVESKRQVPRRINL